jgi:ATP-dependent protease ClpP protease subunit
MEKEVRIISVGGDDASRNKKDSNIHAELNHIYFYSEVDRDSVHELINLMREAEEFCMLTCRATSIKSMPIYIHINSFGGCIFSAFNAIDYIQACKVPVYTIIEGATASAGTLISISGKRRYIRPNAQMLIHQLSSECWGKMSEIEDEFINLKVLMDKLRRHYRAHTKIPEKELRKLLKHDLWLDSAKCIEYGLATKLWTQ